MTRLRRARTTAGRSKYQMRMPYPGTFTPDNVVANFREIARWANELPIPSEDTFMPYFLEYKPEDPEDEWDVNLVTIMQSTFDTELMPTGTWLVYATLEPEDIPVEAVGADAEIVVLGPNATGNNYDSIGYMEGSNAVKVVTDLDVDFTAETFELTYEWYLPRIGSLTYPQAWGMNLLVVNAAEDDFRIQGQARISTITDFEVGPDLVAEVVPSTLYAWAYRLSDGYSIPTTLEDITPP